MGARGFICRDCGHVGDPTYATRGTFCLEAALWLCFIVPGLLYSVWRLASRSERRCRKCGNVSLIPTDSPVGKQLLEAHPPPEEPPKFEPKMISAGDAAKSVWRVLFICCLVLFGLIVFIAISDTLRLMQ